MSRHLEISEESGGRPLVSILAPAYNEAAILEANLGRVCEFMETLEDRYRWEVETTVGKHYGRQHHWEGTIAFLFRWTHFVWNDSFPTTFALGEGFSYATRLPAVEIEDHTDTSKLLNHLVVEWTVALPEWEDWELNFRVHHRSGVYGLIDGVHGGSDFVCLGVRYRF